MLPPPLSTTVPSLHFPEDLSTWNARQPDLVHLMLHNMSFLEELDYLRILFNFTLDKA